MVDELIQLWLDAEEEIRKGDDDQAISMKEEFSEKFTYLNENERLEVCEYLDSCGA